MKSANVIMNIYAEVFKMKKTECHLIVMHQIPQFILTILKNNLKQFILLSRK